VSAPSEPTAAPLEAAAARVESGQQVLAEALTLRLRGPRVTLVGDASAVLGPLLRRAQVTRGIFRVFNEDIARAPLALVPRDPPLPPDLTPLAFVAWSARLGRGLSRRQANQAAAEACDRVGLGVGARTLLGRSPVLARRLTLLAHAAVLDARLVVVEDPLEGLGSDEVNAMMRALDRAVAKAHAIVSTPRADATSRGQALARGADEVVLLEGGRVLEQGRPDEVFTAFTAARVAPSPAPPLALPSPAPPPAAGAPPAPSPPTTPAPLFPLDSPSLIPPLSQRKTRLAPEPAIAPTAPDSIPLSQRTTRLPDTKAPGRGAPNEPARPPAPPVEAAPLTRRAEGVLLGLPLDEPAESVGPSPSVPPTSGDRAAMPGPEAASFLANVEAATSSPEATASSPKAATSSPEAAALSPQAGPSSPGAAASSPKAAPSSREAVVTPTPEGSIASAPEAVIASPAQAAVASAPNAVAVATGAPSPEPPAALGPEIVAVNPSPPAQTATPSPEAVSERAPETVASPSSEAVSERAPETVASPSSEAAIPLSEGALQPLSVAPAGPRPAPPPPPRRAAGPSSPADLPRPGAEVVPPAPSSEQAPPRPTDDGPDAAKHET
jgi:ABC-type cobalamin/Fe3+-siderophores transport system ATPase subunit